MISSIKIPTSEYQFLDNNTNQSITEIQSLSQINIFVGANNSGKSRFMRSLFSSEKFQYTLKEVDMNLLNQRIKNLKDRINNYFVQIRIAPIVTEIRTVLEKMKENEFIENTKFQLYENLEELKSNVQSMMVNTNTTIGHYNFSTIGNALNPIISDEIAHLGVNYEDLKLKKYKFVYIPILRGLRPLPPTRESPPNNENADNYRSRTIFDYFSDDNARLNTQHITHFINKKYNFEIFTGNTLYEDIKNLLLGTHEDRKKVEKYEEYLSKSFFENKPVTLTPRIHSDVLSIQIGDDERMIYDLGDGIQSLIINTFPLFKYADENLLLFIEEPEQTLHPGMQRKLIDTYARESKAQVFITTHSNHLLDLTLESNNNMSIYSFEKTKDEKFRIKNITPNKEILEILGVRNSSVFLSNCIIWVEGVCDRLYINKFLNLYFKTQKKYEEDKAYSILEYGGSNIDKFNFYEPNADAQTINVDSINKKNFIVADNDNYDLSTGIKKGKDKPDSKGLRLRELKQKYPNFFAEYIEIENLIPFKVYKRYFEAIRDTQKYTYDQSLENEKNFQKDVEKEPIGEVLTKYFITIKGTPKHNIESIGDKKR